MGNEIDYEAALKEAIAGADALNQARDDVTSEVAQMDKAVRRATGNKIGALLHFGTRNTRLAGPLWIINLTGEHKDPEELQLKPALVLIAAIREPETPWDLTREVCRVDFAPGGYPVTIQAPQATTAVDDCDSLHLVLRDAFSSPLMGWKLKGLQAAIQRLERPNEGNTE